MDCITGFASSIAKDLACGAVDELGYPFCFNNFVKDLEKEGGNLVATRNSVQDRVEHNNNQARKTAEVVDKWLKDANTDIDNVEELLKNARTNKSCCFGHCPNWIWRCRVGKKLAKKKRDVESCIKEGKKYIQIERVASISNSAAFPSEDFLKFDSRQSAYAKLIEALKDDEVTMIGLYGMGGCGKTTLALELMKTAEAEHLFDKVLFVPVSSTVEVRRIQEKIASALQYPFTENEERERAQRLCERLTNEKRILVIVDDVWQLLKFEDIGIPSSEKHKGCKVLITTRSEDVCIGMDCQRKIQLPLLTDEEAWALFQKQAHISEGTSNPLEHLARQISDECKGLPVAVAAVASTLKGKAEVGWKVALKRLRSSKPVDIERGLQNPYNCLQLSYDNLDIEEAKSLLLLCSVFPEDYEIPVENLTRFAIGLGLVGEVHSYEWARNEVCVAKNKLVSCCLLSDAREGKCVKMHDLIRDVALWIAKNDNKAIKCAIEEEVKVDDSSLRYLWCQEAPNQLDCSNLEFLCISTYLEVSDEIFKGMGKLRVLFLYCKGQRRKLPGTLFKWLKNLRCLFLRGWLLSDISFVGDLKKLESLKLHDCRFIELPYVQRTNLRLLDLSDSYMKRNPFEVIGTYTQLEELYIFNGPYFVDPVWLYDEQTPVESEELHWEEPVEFVKKFSVPQALERYGIHLGGGNQHYDKVLLNVRRTLCLEWFDPSNTGVMDLAKKAEVLCIANIQGDAKSLIPDIFQMEGGGMNELVALEISSSGGIKCLVDTSNHLSKVGTLLSKLRELRINRMERLGALYHGGTGLPPGGLFEKLEHLYLNDCPQLHSTLFVWKPNFCSLKVLVVKHCPKFTSLFTPAVARSLAQLENIEISYCGGLRHIVADDDREEINAVIDDHRLLFPKLKRLNVEWCEKLEYIIPVTFAQGLPQLECLEIHGSHELRYVFGGHCEHGGQLTDMSQNKLKIELPALKELELTEMPNIISVFPEICYPTWLSLHRFHLKNCPEFAQTSFNACIAGYKAGQQCDRGTIKFKGLSVNGEQDPLTTCLEELDLEGLPQLRYIFSACIAGGLPQLTDLTVIEYNQLDQIIEDEERQHFLEGTSIPSATPTQVSGPFNLYNLKRLTLRSCSILRSLFSASTAISLTSLECLEIKECHGLRHLVTYERAHKNEGEGIIQEARDAQCYVSMFPRLKKIKVENCDILEYILPVSSAQGLVEIKKIEIQKTPQLRYVFGESLHDDVDSSHQFQDKIQIELPVLEDLSLECIPNMISFCPDHYYVTCSSLERLVMEEVGLSTQSINNLEGLPINRQEVTSRLENLELKLRLINLPELGYIWRGAKHFVSLQHLYKLEIFGCPKLKAIFSESVLRSLPLLKFLVVKQCEELEQITEEDEGNENVSNPQSPKICFSSLKFLLVSNCNNLKRLFHISTSYEFPELEYLILNQDSRLVQAFEGEIGVREGKVEVLLPKLKYVILMQLPNLKNIGLGIELQALTNLLVHNCHPTLSLTSTTTAEDMLPNDFFYSDQEIYFLVEGELGYIEGVITKEAANKDHDPKTTSQFQVSPEDPVAPKSEQPPSQVNGTNQSILGSLAGPNEHNQIESGATKSESPEFLTPESKNKGMLDLQPSEQKSSPISSPNLARNIEETETAIVGEVPASAKPAIPTSGSELSIEDKVKESVQEGSTLEEAMKATLSPGVDKGISLAGVVATHTESSGRDIVVQDSQVVEQGDKLNECETRALLSQKIQKDDDSVQNEYKEVETGVVSNDSSIEGPPGAPKDTRRSHSLNIAELGAFKNFVGLDDAQIALLEEAIAVYPHLWNVCEKFSVRFQALMLKTLVDMLLFLRKESAVSVTPEREKEFHKLCDEAIQLGFERSWVDEMRQRVMVRDAGVDRAQAQLNELLKRREQLTQELCKVEGDISSLNDFDSRKKCFDFL